MEWIVTECMVAAGCQLEVSAALIGEDVLLCLQGGERPHLGCVVQTEPRVSLSGDGSVRASPVSRKFWYSLSLKSFRPSAMTGSAV